MTDEELQTSFGFSVWKEGSRTFDDGGPWFVQTPTDHIFFGGDEPSARQCLDEIRGLASEITRLRSQLERAKATLKPFADCVFNDNGDMTVTMSNVGYSDFCRAYWTERALTDDFSDDDGAQKTAQR